MRDWYKDLLRSLGPPAGPLHFNPWTVPAYGDFLREVFAEYWWRGRQLTTGEGVATRNCTCKLIDTGTQFAHWTDPHCPQHGEPPRPRPVATYNKPPACSCRYGLRHVDGVAGTHRLGAYRHGWRRGVYAFRIDPRCVHHGRGIGGLRPDYVIVDEYPMWKTLDAGERRGE